MCIGHLWHMLLLTGVPQPLESTSLNPKTPGLIPDYSCAHPHETRGYRKRPGALSLATHVPTHMSHADTVSALGPYP